MSDTMKGVAMVWGPALVLGFGAAVIYIVFNMVVAHNDRKTFDACVKVCGEGRVWSVSSSSCNCREAR